jgi:CBS domain-containing protein
VVRQIRDILSSLEIGTIPDFEYAWIDESLTFVPYTELVKSETPVPPGPLIAQAEPAIGDSDEDRSVVDDVAVMSTAPTDPTYRIGRLDAANRAPVAVPPDATLSAAVTLMLQNDFSQLPVMTTDREVKGVVSWKSVGSRLSLGTPCLCVRDCMDRHPEIISDETSLFRAIELIVRDDFVLVRKADRRICGIVTAADLGETLEQLGRPFLLLGEIENHIRALIDGRFSQQDLRDARNPADGSREVNDVSDLTLGEYIRLVENPDRWEKLRLRVDRAHFVKELEDIARIRNDVMHFDPDGIGPGDLDQLRRFAEFLQKLREIRSGSEAEQGEQPRLRVAR